jgi:hypothetical protein
VKTKLPATADELERLAKLFESNLDVIRRAVRHHAILAIRGLGLSYDELADLEQEGYLEVWVRLSLFDDTRGGMATFADHVVSTKLHSLATARAAKRIPAGEIAKPGGQNSNPDLRHDIRRVIKSLSATDRRLCELLIRYQTPEAALRHSETPRRSFYRAISRIRKSFRASGLM